MSVTIAMPRMSTDPELTTAQSKYVESPPGPVPRYTG